MATAKTADGIENTVRTWSDRLLNVSAEQAHVKPSADRWSISEVIGHLIDSACNNHQRFIRAQATDALEFPKYDQNLWVSAAGYQQADWSTLVMLWRTYNEVLANLIRNIPTESLRTPCTITPYDTCTLEFLVTDYLDHLNHHLEILASRIDAQ